MNTSLPDDEELRRQPSGREADAEPRRVIPSEAEYGTAIEAVLLKLGHPLAWAAPLSKHARLVAETNRTMNLTRLVQADQVAHQQIEDSLLFGAHLPLKNARVLDIGTGAGYPGIPLAIMEPSADILLCDARRKKVDFLQAVLTDLDLGNLQAQWGRAEEVVEEADEWDLAVARAVGSVVEVLETLRPVRHRIRLLALAKGPRVEEELAAAKNLLSASLFRLRNVEAYELSDGRGTRSIAFFEPGGKPLRR